MVPNMRRSKMTASEAAILAGEVKKPSWQSKNEGIHERVSFEDSIWGFDLAGGSFYKTPLRVTAVKKDSRADKAGIRPGDQLLRINDIDTSTLTIQEAHEIIIESGIWIRLAVSAPDDLEDSYHCYEDELQDPYDSEEERRREKAKAKKKIIRCKTNDAWSLQWPWVSKRKIIYKESNCYMVPSKYENKHREKFPEVIPGLKQLDDIVLHSKTYTCETPSSAEVKEPDFIEGALDRAPQNGVDNSNTKSKKEENTENLNGDMKNENTNDEDQNKVIQKQVIPTNVNQDQTAMEVNDHVEVAGKTNADPDKTMEQDLPEVEQEKMENTLEENDNKKQINENGIDDASSMEADMENQVLEDVLNESQEEKIQEDEEDRLLQEVLNGTNEVANNGIGDEEG